MSSIFYQNKLTLKYEIKLALNTQRASRALLYYAREETSLVSVGIEHSGIVPN